MPTLRFPSLLAFALQPPAEQPKAGRRGASWRQVLLTLILVPVGVVIGLLVAQLISGGKPAEGGELPGPLVTIPALLLTLLLTLALHEAGHAAGGRLVGFRFLLYIAGPLMIYRQGERIKLGLNRNLSLYGGLSASLPTDDRDLRRRMAVMIAGGPAASLLLGLLVVAGVLVAGPPQAMFWRLVLATFAGASLLIGMITSLPMRSSGFNSDGARLLSLIRGGPAAERYIAVSAISAALLGGMRPRAWQPAWVERGLIEPDGSPDAVSAHLLAYTYHLDRGEPDLAGQRLDYVLAHAGEYPAAFRPELYQEAAFFHAWHRHDAAAGRAYLEQGRGGMKLDGSTWLRAEAAVLYAEGRREGAAEAARKGLEALKQRPDRGAAQAEAEWLQEILNRCMNE